MLRCRPPWPVAQNGQAMPQPAWLETHIVARSGVAHQHRLDERAVEQLPQRLAGGAAVGLQGAQRRHQRRAAAPATSSSRCGGRQVGHLAPGRRPAGRSSGSRAAWRGTPGSPSSVGQRGPLVGVEVGEVPRRLLAAARLVEDQRQGRALGHQRRSSHPRAATVIRRQDSATSRAPARRRRARRARWSTMPIQHVDPEPAGPRRRSRAPSGTAERDQDEREQLLGACRRRRAGSGRRRTAPGTTITKSRPGEEAGQRGERRVVAVPPVRLVTRRVAGPPGLDRVVDLGRRRCSSPSS